MDAKDSCVFYKDWLDAAHTIADRGIRCTFYEAVLQYALTGMEMDVPNELKLIMTLLKNQIDRDKEKYEKRIEKRREAGRKGNEKRWGTSQDVANIANATNATNSSQDVANIADNVNVNDNDNVNANVNVNDDNINVIKNNTPKSPLGTSGGGEKSFEYLLGYVKTMTMPKKVIDLHFEMQYAWRAMTNPGFVLDVSKACQTISDSNRLEEEISGICKRYNGDGDFARVKLAMKASRLKTEAQRKAVADELRRSSTEQGIYETLIDKVDYILGGNKVSSLQGFMRSRPK